MGTLKACVGTPLRATGLLEARHLGKLRALSVTIVEELLGLIAANAIAAGQFLGVTDLPQLQADAARLANTSLLQEQRRRRSRRYALGARPPQDVLGRVEESARADTFEAYAVQVEEPPGAASETVIGPDLRGCMGPVRNQGSRGTCVAFACCALLECLLLPATGIAADLSEQFLYWSAKQRDGLPDGEGTYVEVAAQALANTGVCLECTWPYNPDPLPGNEAQGPAPPGAATAARNYRATGRDALDPRSSRDIRAMLDGGRPVALSVPVYENWAGNPAVHTLGFIPMPLPTSVLDGGHAMCAVGYVIDDDFTGGGGFIVRNSWGDDWAPRGPIQAGHGILPFEYVDRYGWEAFACR